MMEEYSLVDENWVGVINLSGHAEKISLREAFLHPGQYRSLDGETSQQTAALLRMLLGLSITLLYRYDEKGAPSPLSTGKEALDRWKAVYAAGAFPEAAVDAYFDTWSDRFWLFGEEHPFYQVPLRDVQMVKNDRGPDGTLPVARRSGEAPAHVQDYDPVFSYTWMKGRKIRGTILESDNKENASADRAGKWKDLLTCGEAAAWLVYQMAFADCGIGKGGDTDKSKKAVDADGNPVSLKSTEMTASSRGCILYAEGDTLFETIMLNSILVKDPVSNLELYGEPKPSWEEDRELLTKCRLVVPDNLPALFTQQSRRFMLHRNAEGLVDGAFGAMGDVWEDPGREPMFMWTQQKQAGKKKDSGGTLVMKPIHYGLETAVWQNCMYLTADATHQTQVPGTALWASWAVKTMKKQTWVTYSMVDVSYGTMNSCVTGLYSGAVAVGTDVCRDRELSAIIRRELTEIKEYGKILYVYGLNLAKAEGMESSGKKTDARADALGRRLETEYFDLIGPVFMNYLVDHRDLKELIHAEWTYAYKVRDRAADGVSAEAMTGHEEMSFGSAYGICSGKIGKRRAEKQAMLEKEEDDDD